MQRKRRATHSYSVYIGMYASEEVKSLVERREEDFMHPEHFKAQLFYRKLFRKPRPFMTLLGNVVQTTRQGKAMVVQ